MKIRDRIKEFKRVRAGDLIPNPKNWRRHPKRQADALRGVLSEIGYANALIARETADGLVLIDGHLRAETTPDQEVPVLVLDVTASEADRLLMTLDPLSAMAESNIEALDSLIRANTFESDAVAEMLRAIGTPPVLGASDVADKSDRAGSSPWSRVEASDTVKCLVGDIEFGISREAAVAFADICKDGGDSFRQAARDWMENALLHP